MIHEWLDAVLGDVIEASNGTELRVNCPFCSARVGKPDTKHHMYVSMYNPVAMCFRCTWQGNYISLIMSATGCSYAEALKQLEEPTPDIKKFDKLFSPSGLMAGPIMSSKPLGFKHFTLLDQESTKEERAVWNYLINRRHIPQAIVRRYMGWAPGTNRAWILVDSDFWQGRLIIPGEPKYISAPWPKGDSLWNPNALRDKHIIICEGVFSAIAAGSHAIALCGKTITIPQAKRIVKAGPSSITIMLDHDAIQHSYTVAQTLEEQGYIGVMKIHELSQGDPTDGLDGRVVNFDWFAKARSSFSTAVW
jgi:hypothetical protein